MTGLCGCGRRAEVGGVTTVADVRTLQEAAKDKWSSVIREAIIEVLRRGSFHADDLAPLGIPPQHRNIVGSQTGYLVSKHYMQEVGRRKSTVPSRKGAKSGVYEFTQFGREKLAVRLFDPAPEPPRSAWTDAEAA